MQVWSHSWDTKGSWVRQLMAPAPGLAFQGCKGTGMRSEIPKVSVTLEALFQYLRGFTRRLEPFPQGHGVMEKGGMALS